MTSPWNRLLDGNRRWTEDRSTAAGDRGAARRAELSESQAPFALVVGCADSRVPAEILFDQGLGDLFVVRTAGHVVDAAALGSIEYAVGHLGVSLIVVLGHEGCGAVAAAAGVVDNAAVPAGYVRDIAERIAPDVLRARAMGATTAKELSAQHSLYTLELLRERSALVDNALRTGTIDAVAAQYCLTTGAVTEIQTPALAAA
ncbi:carbonic anhydrase [Actinoplanes bogorensis]|uniref:Carbonic anhydrase n=1 Tax=Paractinoplanes bogorensis TaxID=1610840 RepID=A0ABS5YS45_9ACTN|nr:carbonic anhydrase [Actinoplanes bogorensis]MBU2666277.1 carbonic anhydrase [Actinoplanes bogorensis]